LALIEPGAQLTPREFQQMEYEERLWDKQAKFNLEVKKLELEVAKIDTRWGAIFKIPTLIIKLPVYILLALGFIIYTVTKKEPPDKFWDFINK